MRQRVTADLTAIRKQAHAAGVAEGRAELARELRDMPGNVSYAALLRLEHWLDGYAVGFHTGRGDLSKMELFRNDVRSVLALIAALDQEAASEQPF